MTTEKKNPLDRDPLDYILSKSIEMIASKDNSYWANTDPKIIAHYAFHDGARLISEVVLDCLAVKREGVK